VNQKLMTEPEAWRSIAEVLEITEEMESGLCAEVAELEERKLISLETRRQMMNRIDKHVNLGPSVIFLRADDGLAWEQTEEPEWRELRTTFACFLALEAEDDKGIIQ